MTSEAKIWKSGLPYAPQAQKLKEAHPLPEEGAIITHEDLEKLVNETRQTQRYYGICNAWRNYLFNALNVDTAWEPAKGIKILTPAERLDVRKAGFLAGSRKQKREARKYGATPRERLDTTGQQRYDHEMTCFAKAIMSADQSRKELPIPLAPVKSLPRPKLIEKKVS